MKESKQNNDQQGQLRLDWPVFIGLTTRRGWTTDAKRAEGIGIKPSQLSRLKNKKCEPSAGLMYDLPDLLGVPMKVLFYRQKEGEQ